MKIQSKFKDYYDTISYKFGQDPDCIYNRGPLPEDKLTIPYSIQNNFPHNWLYTDHTRYMVYYNLCFVVAGPHVVPFLEINGKYFKLGPQHEYLLNTDWYGRPVYPAMPNEQETKDLIKLVGAPVFMVRNRERDNLYIEQKVPILKDLGFANIVPATQMWQDIYSTLTTVLRKNPDKEPPITVSNDERIEAAGFDLKTSFRNPINKKVKR
jgi:hypothetical protein